MTERRVIAIGNQKGGTGKITTALNPSWAQLYRADLEGTALTDEQLAQAETPECATLPDGTVRAWGVRQPEVAGGFWLAMQEKEEDTRAMTESPTDDNPGFVADRPEHCSVCFRLILPGQVYYLTIEDTVLCA